MANPAIAQRAKEEWAVARGSLWGALKTPLLHSLNMRYVHGTGRRNFLREAPCLVCPKFCAFTCYCKVGVAQKGVSSN
jgi:hypothetical protein